MVDGDWPGLLFKKKKENLNTICACGRGDASLMTESQSGVEAQQRLVATRSALANMFTIRS